MQKTTLNCVETVYNTANKSIDEIEYIYSAFSNIQRNLLVSLLNEERETLEPHIEQNTWANDRVLVIDSILNRLSN